MNQHVLNLIIGLAFGAGLIVTVVIFLNRTRRRCPLGYSWPVTFIYNSLKIKGDMSNFQLKPGFELPFVLGKPVLADGVTEAPVEDGSLKISSTDEAVFTIAKDDQAENPDDPYTGKIVYVGLGKANFHVEADADLGAGVDTITMDIEGEMLAAEAAGFAGVTFGAPRPVAAKQGE